MRPIVLGTTWMVVAALSASGQPAATSTHENLNALVWTQRSAEYRALSLQTFQAARASLQVAIRQPGWTAALEQQGSYRELPPAIVLDLDETALDNSPFQVKLVKDGLAYSEGLWQQWVDREEALAVPGAVEFLNFAQSEGVVAFYITNRVCDASSSTDHTVAVLRKLNFPLAPSRLLCRASATESSNKSERRKQVAAGHRVLLMFGDDLNDFVAVPVVSGDWRARIEERFRIVQAHVDKWGSRWFLLPNPMYGSWERAIGEGVQPKLDALRP